MAAIDKMYLKDYYVFDDFRLWCIAHKPTLLYHFYNWNMNEKEWNEWKESCYNTQKKILERVHEYSTTVESLENHYILQIKDLQSRYPKDNIFYEGIPKEQLEREVQAHLKDWREIQNKKSWIENKELPITNFSCEEDQYLLRHCPIKEIREYLIDQCGYKEKWYYKLFFKK